MKKKLLTLLLAFATFFCLGVLSACNDPTPNGNDGNDTQTNENIEDDGSNPNSIYTVSDEIKQEQINAFHNIKEYELTVVVLDHFYDYTRNIIVNENYVKTAEMDNEESTTEYFAFNLDEKDWKYTYYPACSAFMKEEYSSSYDPRESHLSDLLTFKDMLLRAEFDEEKKCYSCLMFSESSGIETYVVEFYFENNALVKFYMFQEEKSSYTDEYYYQKTCTYSFKEVQKITLPQAHEHTLADALGKDELYHWNTTACASHDETVINKETHQFKGNTCSVCEYTAQESEGLTYELSSSEDYYIVTGEGSFSGGTLVIPDEYNSLPVKEIKWDAFFRAPFTTVIIPDSIIHINSSAFENCSNLESVYIGNGVYSIWTSAFKDCSNLKKVVIGTGIKEIGSYAFDNIDSLAEFYIYATVPPEISSSAWDLRGTGCTLYVPLSTYDTYASIWEEFFCVRVLPEEETLVDGVCYTSDGTGIIFVDKNKRGNFVIPDGVKKIYSSAFSNCSKMTDITIPSSVNYIGAYAFSGLTTEGTKIYYNGTASQWAQIDFESSSANPLYYTQLLYIDGNQIQTVSLSNIEKIADYAFYNCRSLTNVIIGEGTTVIGASAFYNCYNLMSCTIPDSVNSIQVNAFLGCTKIRQVENGVAYVANWAVGTDSGSSLTSLTFKMGTRGIANYAFYSDQRLTHITIPNSVQFIGINAFYECQNLTHITFEENSQLTSIEEGVFCGCSKLTSVVIPKSVKSIGARAFYFCSRLTSVVFEENSQLESIGARAFYNCSQLTTIVIPNGIISINPYALEYDSLIFYMGTEKEWNEVSGSAMNACPVAFYSEESPGYATVLLWHYVDGVPTLWD